MTRNNPDYTDDPIAKITLNAVGGPVVSQPSPSGRDAAFQAASQAAKAELHAVLNTPANAALNDLVRDLEDGQALLIRRFLKLGLDIQPRGFDVQLQRRNFVNGGADGIVTIRFSPGAAGGPWSLTVNFA